MYSVYFMLLILTAFYGKTVVCFPDTLNKRLTGKSVVFFRIPTFCTQTACLDIIELLLKVALNTHNTI